jgi:hypothetical protein
VSVRVYVEGGGNNKDTLKRCQEGFARYCRNAAPNHPQPRIVACGGRQQAFNRFRTAVLNAQANESCVLLVDAESAVSNAGPVNHLQARDGWSFPDLGVHQVFLMVQAMVAWLLADHGALAAFYGQGFLVKSLPGNPDVESIPKDDLEPRLRHASAPTKTKREYHKTRHGFAILAMIDPVKVATASPHAKLFNDFLRSL